MAGFVIRHMDSTFKDWYYLMKLSIGNAVSWTRVDSKFKISDMRIFPTLQNAEDYITKTRMSYPQLEIVPAIGNKIIAEWRESHPSSRSEMQTELKRRREAQKSVTIEGNGTVAAAAIGKLLQRKQKILINNTNIEISKMQRIRYRSYLIVSLSDGRKVEIDDFHKYRLTQDGKFWRLSQIGANPSR